MRIKDDRNKNFYERDEIRNKRHRDPLFEYDELDDVLKFFKTFIDDDFFKEKSQPQTPRQNPFPEHDCFAFMGLNSNATKEEVYKRYRELAKKAHPDAGGSSSEFIKLKDNRDRCLKNLK